MKTLWCRDDSEGKPGVLELLTGSGLDMDLVGSASLGGDSLPCATSNISPVLDGLIALQ